MGHGHSAQWATDFCGFPDAKRLLLYFAAWAGVEAGNSRVYLKIKKKKGRRKPCFPSDEWVDQPKAEQREEFWTSSSPGELENMSEYVQCTNVYIG